MRKLTPKQKKFADQYILTGKSRQSAIEAGYSEKTASEIASENLNKPNVSEYIKKQLEELEFDAKIRQKQTIDYALRVLQEEETEEHAFVTGDEMGSDVKVVRLKPKIKDKTEAAKFITSITSAVEKNRLQNIKLEQQIKKLEAETKNEESGAKRVVFYDNEEELRRVMDEYNRENK